MLQFYAASTRIVNTKRSVTECLEIALGEHLDQASLLIFNASVGHDFQDLIEQAHQMAPQAQIVAASCCGVVGREGVSESMKDMALMALTGNEFALAGTSSIYGHNSYDECVKMAKALQAQKTGINMIYFIASGIDINNSACIRGFETVFGEDVTVFGATTSDNMKGYVSFQAFAQQVTEHGAFAIGFCDPSLTIDTQATHGFMAIGEPMTVTKSNGHIIEELNGKPAWSTFLERLGLPKEADCGHTIPVGALAELLPPEVAEEYGNQHILRVVTKHEGEHIYYATSCNEGTQLWFTIRDEELIFKEMDRMVTSMCQRAGGKKPVAVFHADCLARGRYLTNRVLKEELVHQMQTPFYSGEVCPPWLGMYGFGEFARLNGKNTYHNYTTALYLVYRKN
ncbi:MAG: FIST signal transduction protein [Flavobacterium sp.]|jgi:hypothetical protein|uniref:FIST signal transduction protein n=1 Tax=Flavobacterium sp. TaxID=239 RepID=UPI0022C8CD4E|nr:FIST N-terminal domain-containing protein [Flavobacterium sp.]MCZ8168886.1 FIST C-terminal domain-containing protein [Flavobacterium sp.]MCZ8297455.1 FIST C-terminal domain-containing protein [Flavobacterium sp.]